MLPKKVSVLGRKHVVKKSLPKDLPKTVKDAMNRDFDGLFYGAKAEIWINPKQDLEAQWRTMFHEVGHAIMYRNGLRFSDLVDERVEEVIVETFGNVFFELFDSMYPEFWKGDDDG